ncbi:MAG: nucleotidyl transferase AbiEii/AbiGii toxin family protein [Bacteroidia bacterium]|nr:nucleotidyl transferase AbiEii/AbiGii toxin family protein [Bacteroidia bacterium]
MDNDLLWIRVFITSRDKFSEDIDFTSEDIDFTLLDYSISNEQIFEWFKQIFEYVREEANIPLEIIDNNEHEGGGINFYISYIGPLGGQRSSKKIKVDISRSEKMEFKPVIIKAFKVYTDTDDFQLLCYPLEEVLIEKMRSVMQRMQARDFYDIWYLMEKHGLNIDLCMNEFNNKCTGKGLKSFMFPAKLSERVPQYRGRWQVSMNDQIKDLPGFEQVEREVQRILKKLNF